MPKAKQAELIWQTLFLDHSPVSESCLGVLTSLHRLNVKPTRNLETIRDFFRKLDARGFVDLAFSSAKCSYMVMTNDPFDEKERAVWERGFERDYRFKAALRVDPLLNNWLEACKTLKAMGYEVGEELSEGVLGEIRRFLTEWLEKMEALYLAVSLPPSFVWPEESYRGKLIENCILPVAREKNVPFAMMIGVKKLVNPELRLAGDAVGKASIDSIERLLSQFPKNKFLMTFLSRENQHEACIAARKFNNMMLFGCWWFTNIPTLVEEITRMRVEWLGTSFIPQHSDARVLDQIIYKWEHFREIFTRVLIDKYLDVRRTGWPVTEEDIARDVNNMLSGNFERFLSLTPE
jgi:hypothetical protein